MIERGLRRESARIGLIMLVVLSTGLFLRVYDLEEESIWVDEGYSVKLAKMNVHEILGETSRDVHPPTYYVNLRVWLHLFGGSEASSRFLSVIFSFFTLLILYKLGRLLFDRNVGILASFIMALSVFHIHYSQEARHYSMMAFLSACSMYFFMKLLERRSLTASIGYVSTSVLLMYTHAFGIFIVLAQNIYFLTLPLFSKDRYKLNLKKWIILQTTLAALYTPWIKVLISQTLRIQSDFWIPKPSLLSIADSFFQYSGSYLSFWLFLALASLSIVTRRRTKDITNPERPRRPIEQYLRSKLVWAANRNHLVLLVWLMTLIIFPFIISQFSSPIYMVKYTIAASLPFYLFVAKGVSNIRSRYPTMAVVSVLIVVSSANVLRYYTLVNKEKWRDVVAYVEMNASPTDLLLFYAGYCQTDAFDYYSERSDLVKKPVWVADEQSMRKLEVTLKNYSRVWLILSHSDAQEELIKETMRRSHALSRQEKYASYHFIHTTKSADIEVCLFEKSPHASAPETRVAYMNYSDFHHKRKGGNRGMQ